jgi:hypothetical protein
MIERPSAEDTLQGLARFLLEELRPVVTDKVLAYKVLVAAHIASGLSREAALGAAFAEHERERLGALLPAAPADAGRAALLAELIAEVRAPETPGPRLAAIRRATLASLREELVAVNPFFDTGLSPT